MRITNRMIANNMNNSIQRNLSTVARSQEQLATGKSMLRPSDHPENMSQLLSVKSSLSYMEQFNRNIDDGLSYLNMNDSTMQNMGDVLHQITELAVQGSNSSLTKADLAALGEQVDKMIDHVVDLANSSVGGRYIYAGTDNNRAPFKREGDKILFTGDMNGISREVISGENYRIDAPGVTTGFQVAPVMSSTTTLPEVTQRQVPSKLVNTGIITVTRTDTGFTISNPTQLDGVTPAPNLVTSFSVTGDVITVDGAADDLQGLVIDMTGTAAGEQYNIIIDNKLGVFGHATKTSPGVYEVYNPGVQKDHSVDEGVFDVLFKLRDRLRSADTGVDIIPLVNIGNISPNVVSRQVPEKLDKTGMFTVAFTAPNVYTISDERKLDGVTGNDFLVTDWEVQDRQIWQNDQLVTKKILKIKGSNSDLEGFEIDLTGMADGDSFRVVVDGNVESSIKELRSMTDELLQRRVGIGARTRHFEALQEQLMDWETKLTEVESKLEDADIYRLSIRMSEDQVTFQASLAAGANILRVSLLDFLK